VIKAVLKLPFRVVRRILRMLRNTPSTPDPVDLPVRTDPDGPNLQPTPAPPVASPAPAPASAPVPVAEAQAPPTTAAGHTAEGAEGAEGARKKTAPSKPRKAKATEPAAAPPASDSVIRAERTPNPNAMKFTCPIKVVPKGSLSFANAEVAKGHPLGEALFALSGVRMVFAVSDFVTVTKEADADWDRLAPEVDRVLRGVVGAEAR
jgi:hypothetical protein